MIGNMNYEYKEYLKSEEWKEKRLQFLEDVGHECEQCGNRKHLQVHHLNYFNLFNETKDDVEVLCEDCHKNVELERGKAWSMDDDYGEI